MIPWICACPLVSRWLWMSLRPSASSGECVVIAHRDVRKGRKKMLLLPGVLRMGGGHRAQLRRNCVLLCNDKVQLKPLCFHENVPKDVKNK